MATFERLGEMMKLWYFNLNDVWVWAGYSTFSLVHGSQCNNYEKIKIKYIIYILLKLKIIIYKNKNNYKKFKINK